MELVQQSHMVRFQDGEDTLNVRLYVDPKAFSSPEQQKVHVERVIREEVRRMTLERLRGK